MHFSGLTWMWNTQAQPPDSQAAPCVQKSQGWVVNTLWNMKRGDRVWLVHTYRTCTEQDYKASDSLNQIYTLNTHWCRFTYPSNSHQLYIYEEHFMHYASPFLFPSVDITVSRSQGRQAAPPWVTLVGSVSTYDAARSHVLDCCSCGGR